MLSDAQWGANRANAALSTGPLTAQGKARSCKNAVKHGLFCTDLVLPGEDAEQLKPIRRSMIDRLKPQDALELNLVERIVQAHWKLRRCDRGERHAYEQFYDRRRTSLERSIAELELN